MEQELRNALGEFKNELKAEMHELRGEMHEMRDELREEMHGMRDELREEMHEMRDELREEMHEMRMSLDAKIDGVEERLGGRIDVLDDKVTDLQQETAYLKVRADHIDQHLGYMDTSIRILGETGSVTNRKIDSIGAELSSKIDHLDHKFDKRISDVSADANGRMEAMEMDFKKMQADIDVIKANTAYLSEGYQYLREKLDRTQEEEIQYRQGVDFRIAELANQG